MNLKYAFFRILEVLHFSKFENNSTLFEQFNPKEKNKNLNLKATDKNSNKVFKSDSREDFAKELAEKQEGKQKDKKEESKPSEPKDETGVPHDYIWLKHIYPERFVNDKKYSGVDEVHAVIESAIDQLAFKISKQHNLDIKQATEFASNIFIQQSLELQRHYSPKGYKAMISTALVADPLMESLRKEFYTLYKKNSNTSFYKGILMGTGCLLTGASACLFVISIFFK